MDDSEYKVGEYEKRCAKITLEFLYLIRKDFLKGYSSDSIVSKCLQMIPILEAMAGENKTLN